jgi:uncharacterized protein (DUF1810 family)
MSRLDRFKSAQGSSHAGYEVALREIRAGRKRSHWIWYVFPQLSGMGSSSMSRTYAIDGVAEATEFLRDSELRSRLRTIAEALAEQLRSEAKPALSHVMGSEIDANKIVSSMTLFGHVAKELNTTEPSSDLEAIAGAAEEILRVAATQGYPPCAHTLRVLQQSP